MKQLDGPPEKKRRKKAKGSVSWVNSFDYVEFSSRRSPSNTIKKCMQRLELPADSDEDDDVLAGDFEDWDSIVKAPKNHPLHTERANDRSLAYARRRALDLERAPGVTTQYFDPVVVIFWDGGLAEKVEYGFY